MPFISSKPLIYDVAGRNGIISPVVNSTFGLSETDPNQMAELAGLLNVKYFVLDGYVDSTLKNSYNQSAQDNFHLEATFDRLEVFSINQSLFFPRVYVTSDAKLAAGNVSAQSSDLLNFTNSSAASKPVMFMSSQLSTEDWQFLQNLNLSSNAQETFTQINPTQYVVHVTSSGPTFLVLSAQFDDSWTASVGGKQVDSHFIANGYANAWYISDTGSFDVTLNYSAQTYFYIALSVSAVAFVVCVSFIWLDILRPKAITGKVKLPRQGQK